MTKDDLVRADNAPTSGDEVEHARLALDRAIENEDTTGGVLAWLRLSTAQSDLAEIRKIHQARRARRRLVGTAFLFSTFFGVALAVLGIMAKTPVKSERFILRLESTELSVDLAQEWRADRPVLGIGRIDFTDFDRIHAVGEEFSWPADDIVRHEAKAVGRFNLVQLSVPAETSLHLVTSKAEAAERPFSQSGDGAAPVQLAFNLKSIADYESALFDFVSVDGSTIEASNGDYKSDLQELFRVFGLATSSRDDSDPKVVVTVTSSNMRVASDLFVTGAHFLNPEGKSTLLGGDIFAESIARETAISERDQIEITFAEEQEQMSLSMRVEADRIFVDWTIAASEMLLHSPGRPEKSLMPTRLDRLAARITVISVFWTLVVSLFGVALWILRSWWKWNA